MAKYPNDYANPMKFLTMEAKKPGKMKKVSGGPQKMMKKRGKGNKSRKGY